MGYIYDRDFHLDRPQRFTSVPSGVEDARRWERLRLALRDTCNRCARYYDELSPECANTKLHERYTAEQEAKTRRRKET